MKSNSSLKINTLLQRIEPKTQKYFAKKIRTELPIELKIYGDLFIGQDLTVAADMIVEDTKIFSPYKSLFMRRHGGLFGAEEIFKQAWKISIEHVHSDYLSGKL